MTKPEQREARRARQRVIREPDITVKHQVPHNDKVGVPSTAR